MRILHVTPHLPPDQAANALLPWQLGVWARERGDQVEYLAHPPRSGGPASDRPGPVTWVPRRNPGLLDRHLRLGALTGALRIHRVLTPRLDHVDIVHVHSNGLLSEIAVLLARRHGTPVVLTLYGTEIWHYQPKRLSVDLFTRAYREASYVTFYSEGLMARAHELGLGRRDSSAVYPPIATSFVFHDEEGQASARTELGLTCRHVLLNVKRLHPLAGQKFLIEAMSEIIRAHPDTRLVICGTGPLLAELKRMAASAGVERHVIFPGLVDNARISRYCAAADLFVLPSLLEALPTVAVEALASGTPVLSSDNPGGLELNGIFGPDVSIVPRDQPMPLAAAVVHFLENKRRTLPGTRAALEREFSTVAIADRYWSIYSQIAGQGRA
jgi:glycosyltransferase involved in cell wall biosynthesis